jgi:hypothetical protein
MIESNTHVICEIDNILHYYEIDNILQYYEIDNVFMKLTNAFLKRIIKISSIYCTLGIGE